MGNSDSSGSSSSSDSGGSYHGSNYDSNGGGFYNSGYERGYEDAATRSTSDPVDYVTSCTSEGNRGYVDGTKDGGNWSSEPNTLDFNTAVNNVLDAYSNGK